MNSVDYRHYISEIPDFPKKGILFCDICPLMLNPDIWRALLNELALFVDYVKPDIIAGIDARGFIVGSAVATYTSMGFVPIRKKGKLPGSIIGVDYQLEYGHDRLEIQKDSVNIGTRVLIIDDLLATGGTARTAGDLINKLNAIVVGYSFVVELDYLNGRNKLEDNIPIKSIVNY